MAKDFNIRAGQLCEGFSTIHLSSRFQCDKFISYLLIKQKLFPRNFNSLNATLLHISQLQVSWKTVTGPHFPLRCSFHWVLFISFQLKLCVNSTLTHSIVSHVHWRLCKPAWIHGAQLWDEFQYVYVKYL